MIQAHLLQRSFGPERLRKYREHLSPRREGGEPGTEAIGPACPWTWLRGLEGIGVALVAWVAAEGIATYWGGVWRELTPWEQGRVLGRVSLIVAIILVLAWGLVGLALCRGWA